MLFLTYLRSELRHRLRQSVFIAAGLAVGVALVITVSAVAAGTSNAQAGVLHGLYGVGTDMTVTRPYTPRAASPGHEINGSNGPTKHLEFLGTNQSMFDSSVAATIAGLRGVRAATPMLALDESDITTGAGAPKANPSNSLAGVPGTDTLVDAVDTANQQLGPLSEARIVSGRGLTASDADADVALVDSSYATAHHFHVGSVITLAYHKVRIVGIFSVGAGSSSASPLLQPSGAVPHILIPLRTGQTLSGSHDKITTVYVATTNAADLGALTAKIKAQWPWANVTTSASLAHEISGSLATTARLAKDLGRWLAVAVLAAAFAVAALLTVIAVSRRVREFGTLKALGWSTGRITAQVLGESVTIGVAGALAGVGLGYAAAALISRLARNLNAIAAAAPGTTEPHGFIGGVNGKTGQHFSHPLLFPGTYNSLPVHFHAPVALSVVALAVALGIAGGLLAGALGSWRAARLSPTVALAHAG